LFVTALFVTALFVTALFVTALFVTALATELPSLSPLSLSSDNVQQTINQVKNIDRYTHKLVRSHVEINSALAQIFGRDDADLPRICSFNDLASDLLPPPGSGLARHS
jgi:hypothetical protein